MPSNVIKDTFTSEMKAAGFSKKADGWYQETADSVLVANLQKSNFGEQYYLNLGVWLKALGEVAYPKEYQCHIRLRAGTLEPDLQKYWEGEVFNLEHESIGDEERQDLVRSFMITKAMPFLRAAGTLPGLRNLYREGALKSAAVMTSAQQILAA